MSLVTGVVRWVVRNAASLALIVLILYAGNLLRREWNQSVDDVVAARTALPALQAGLERVQDMAKSIPEELAQDRRAIQSASTAPIASYERKLSTKLADLKKSHPTGAGVAILLATGNQTEITTYFENEVRIRLIERELGFLEGFKEKETLEALRARHKKVYSELAAAFDVGDVLLCPKDPDSFSATFPARFSSDAGRRLRLCKENKAAFAAYQEQERRLRLLVKLPTAEEVSQMAIRPLQAMVENTRRLSEKNSIGVILHEIASYVPMAVLILTLALVAPLLIKTFLYYVIAPIASRRPPIRILPALQTGGQEGSIGRESNALVGSISAVSRQLDLDSDQELIVHSDYLQSSGTSGRKQTKWFLNARYPIMSLAAGMTVLTRIRPTGPESIVVSATTDPLSEVGVLTLGEGEVFILQPRNLIGVLQRRNYPVRISSHWRLGSLTAWLTLQLRYLAFHGPGSLIVKGCRGVRVERAGTGRMINQSATMGFSATLAYSTTRNETFVAYLLGKQELFNDLFVDGPGVYMYEEMPLASKKAGITGRGLEGLLDSIMKVFGI